VDSAPHDTKGNQEGREKRRFNYNLLFLIVFLSDQPLTTVL
jgi:hypothetical protein